VKKSNSRKIKGRRKKDYETLKRREPSRSEPLAEASGITLTRGKKEAIQ